MDGTAARVEFHLVPVRNRERHPAPAHQAEAVGSYAIATDSDLHAKPFVHMAELKVGYLASRVAAYTVGDATRYNALSRSVYVWLAF